MQGEKRYQSLPELRVEVYLSEQNNPDTCGINNSDEENCDGLILTCKPNDGYSQHIAEILRSGSPNFPFEFYNIEFLTLRAYPIMAIQSL